MKIIRRRRKEGLTNYKKRIILLKSRIPRLVIRKSNRSINIQIVEYLEDGDKVLLHVESNRLAKFGWPARRNTPTAYLTGMLFAKMAKEKKLDKEYILDIGLHKPTKASILFAAAKGAVDSGLNLRNSIEFDESRIDGTHIKNYAEKVAGKKHQFSAFKEAAEITELFNKVKNEINKAE